MNRERRKKITDLMHAIESLKISVENLADADNIKTEVEEICNNEQDAFDALPESLQTSEKTETLERLETAESKLEEIATAITTLNDDLQEVLDALEAAKV